MEGHPNQQQSLVGFDIKRNPNEHHTQIGIAKTLAEHGVRLEMLCEVLTDENIERLLVVGEKLGIEGIDFDSVINATAVPSTTIPSTAAAATLTTEAAPTAALASVEADWVFLAATLGGD